MSNALKCEICDLDIVSQMYVNDLLSDNNKQILKDAFDLLKDVHGVKKCPIVPLKCSIIPIAIIKTFPIIISDYSDSCDLCHCLTSPQCRTKFGNKEEAPIRKKGGSYSSKEPLRKEFLSDWRVT